MISRRFFRQRYGMCLRQVVIRGQMPIELVKDLLYSEASLAALHESVRQLDEGKTVTKTMEELQALE